MFKLNLTIFPSNLLESIESPIVPRVGEIIISKAKTSEEKPYIVDRVFYGSEGGHLTESVVVLVKPFTSF